MDRATVSKVIQKDLECGMGSFTNLVYRRDNWVAALSTDVSNPRWNRLVPLPDESSGNFQQVPRWLKEICSAVGHQLTLYGETDWIDEVREALEPDLSKEYELTYLIPTAETFQREVPADLSFREVGSGEVKKDFLRTWKAAFEEEFDGGIPEDVEEGVWRMLEDRWFTGEEISIVGYSESKPVCAGTLAIKNGICFPYNVSVRPGRQGEGLGTAITIRILEEARERDRG
ncbi:MAG: hypothetical protein ABEJ07_05020 [Candidatus Nanohaloarchaea archaeon]